jgi:hypothetical protein
VSLPTTPAFDRLSASAGRILGHLGGEMSFRRLVAVKDPRLGSETWSPSGEEIPAAAHRFQGTRKKEGGVRERCEKIAVERAPFEDLGGLSDEWEVLLGGDWTALENVVLAEDRTTWEADLCLTSSGEGAP